MLGIVSLREAGDSGRRRPGRAWPAAGSATFAALATLVALGSLSASLLRVAGDRALYRLRVAEFQNRWTDAVAEGRAAVWVDPRPAALLALARAELRLGQPAAAQSLLERVLEVWPQDATATGTLGLARLALGDPRAGPTLGLARALGVGDAQEPRLDPAKGGDSCAAGITFEQLTSGRVNLSARMQPVTAVLRCLGDRTGLHVEYDGPPPRQTVTLNLSDASLATAVETLFEGLGLDFVLSADPRGATLSRVIVFAASGTTRSPGSSSPASSPPAASPEPDLLESDWVPPVAEEPPPESPTPPPALFPGGPPGIYQRGPLGDQRGPLGGASAVPGFPEYPDPPALTPTGG